MPDCTASHAHPALAVGAPVTDAATVAAFASEILSAVRFAERGHTGNARRALERAGACLDRIETAIDAQLASH